LHKLVKTTSYKESLVVNVTKEDLRKKILEEPDFVKSAKHSNSLMRYLTKNPKEIDNKTIARLLMISEEEVEEIYEWAVGLLKHDLVESDED
jgi:hypothetical protein